MRDPALGFAEILALWLSITAAVVLFAALRMASDLAWVSFAAALNGAISWMKRA